MSIERCQEGVGDAPAGHVKSCTNHDPVQRKLANLADVLSALSLPSEEQYSKCTYPLCFDFSQCPLTQPFHIFVYSHHFRNLFNFKYPVTVDSLWPSLQHSLPHFWPDHSRCGYTELQRGGGGGELLWLVWYTLVNSVSWHMKVHSASLVPTLSWEKAQYNSSCIILRGKLKEAATGYKSHVHPGRTCVLIWYN